MGMKGGNIKQFFHLMFNPQKIKDRQVPLLAFKTFLQ